LSAEPTITPTPLPRWHIELNGSSFNSKATVVGTFVLDSAIKITAQEPGVGMRTPAEIVEDQHTGLSENAGPSVPCLSWSYLTGNGVSSSPALGSDGAVYVGSEDNNLYALNSGGAFAWSYRTGRTEGSSPAVGSDGSVYVGSWDTALYAIHSSGTLIWSYRTGAQVVSSPALGEDRKVYVGSWDNALYCITQAPTPTPMPETTPTPFPGNYIQLDGVEGGGRRVTLSYRCNLSQYDYRGVPVNIYLGATGGGSSLGDVCSTGSFLKAGNVYLYGPGLKAYKYKGSVGRPTWSGVAFPPQSTAGSVSISLPGKLKGARYGVAFIQSGSGEFVRTDGLPVETTGYLTPSTTSSARQAVDDN
jgi:hypothetical protein